MIAPCGFDLARTLRRAAGADRPATRGARCAAVRDGRAYAADGNLYFNRSSPTLFETPGLLAEMLHPDHFPPRPSAGRRRLTIPG